MVHLRHFKFLRIWHYFYCLHLTEKHFKTIFQRKITFMDYFNAVLLVDDDDATNFYHEIVLEEWGKVKNIYVALNGKQAIDFLKEHDSFRYERPSLILLDINMPVMNGFEFLEAYRTLDDDLKASFVVVMLTTSLHPKDQNKAQGFNELRGYINKPLTVEELEKILQQAQSTTK